jgi:Protein of unknown function (DUF2939)
MSRSVRIALVVGVLGLLAWIAAAPWLTVHAMRKAAERGDAAALASHVDFPAVRAHFKAQLADAARRRLGAEGDGTGGWRDLGASLLASAATPLIDSLASEAGLTALFTGRGALDSLRDRSADTMPMPDGGGIATADWHLRMRYRDLSTFVVAGDLGGDPSLPATLVFERRNLVQWTLTEVDLSQVDGGALLRGR